LAKRNQKGKNNNNPTGRNQYTNDWLSPAKDHPLATAAAVAGAVGAGVFLWSKRNQVSNQVSKISQTASEMSRKAGSKASEWIDKMQSGSSSRELAMTDGPNESSAIEASRRTQSRSASRTPRPRSDKTNAAIGASRANAEIVS